MADTHFIEQLESLLGETRQQIASTRQALAAKNIAHRHPPSQPTTCCGRGCNGCVWESWYAAVQYWQEQADQLLSQTPS